MSNESNIKKIQSCVRGYLIRKNNKKIKDNMSYKILLDEIERYNNNLLCTNEVNKLLSKKKIRHENFPSHISENIVKFAIYKKYKIMPNWDTDVGDLCVNNLLKIEVKGFMSDGPSSFGPTEKWQLLYFVNAKDTLNKIYQVYEIKLSNIHPIFRNIKLNKNETYGEIADKNQRGKLRGSFYKIFKPQLKDHCHLIFDGEIKHLNDDR